jgi:hypothetical protein
MQIANSDIWVGRGLSCRLLESFAFFAIVFRRTAARETFLRPDETILRFGADVRKHRIVINSGNQDGGQRRDLKPERVKCET